MNQGNLYGFLTGTLVLALAAGPAQATLLVDPTDESVDALTYYETTAGVFPDGGLRSGGEEDLWEVVGDDEVVLYDLLYKANEDDGEEDRPLRDSYETTFGIGHTSDDPSSADITHVAATEYIACGDQPCYLAVKDGNVHEPPQYVFDITEWNGRMTLELRNFWSDQGAVSHVSIFGLETSTEVPAPGTLALFGFSLLVLAGFCARLRADW